MSASRVLGFVILLIAAVYVVVAVVDNGSEYTSAPRVVEQYEDQGLQLGTTDIRFRVGIEGIVDLVCIGLLVLVGWWLTTVETQQYTYLYVGGAILLASIVIRVTPLVPPDIARYSPGALFFGACVSVNAVSDETANWIIIPPRQTLRVATVTGAGQQQGGIPVILDFAVRQDLQQRYLSSYPPVPIEGIVFGTHVVVRAKELHILPCIRVQAIGR